MYITFYALTVLFASHRHSLPLCLFLYVSPSESVSFLWNVHSDFFLWCQMDLPSHCTATYVFEDLFVFKSVGNIFFPAIYSLCLGISVRSLWNAGMSFVSPLSFCNRKHHIAWICSNSENGICWIFKEISFFRQS